MNGNKEAPVNDDVAAADPNVAAELHEILKLLRTVASMIHRLEVRFSHRNLISGALYHLAFEHCGSLIELVRWGRNGSAMALARPAFESYLRAAWVHYCADDDRLAGIAREGLQFPGNRDMDSALNLATSHEAREVIAAINSFIPPDMRHGLTHGGIEQIAARLDGKSIRADFTAEGIIGALRTAAGIASVSAMGIARQCDREDLAQAIAGIFLNVVRSSLKASKKGRPI